MSEMSLVLSEKFTAEDAASIRAEIGRRLQVGKPVSLRQRSIDPPSVIQLLGEAVSNHVKVPPPFRGGGPWTIHRET